MNSRSRRSSRTASSSIYTSQDKGKGKEMEMDYMNFMPSSEQVAIDELPSVVVAEVFVTPAGPMDIRNWEYIGRLAIRLTMDEDEERARIFARRLGRRGAVEIDALLTHPLIYSDNPVGVSMWLAEPEEELKGYCFRFESDIVARQFATLASYLTKDDPVIERNVRRIEDSDAPSRKEAVMTWMERTWSRFSGRNE